MPSSSGDPIAGLSGRLVTATYVRDLLASAAAAPPPAAARALEAWAERIELELGPASSVRAVADLAVAPLLALLGYAILRRSDQSDCCHLEVGIRDRPISTVVVRPWHTPLRRAWRETVSAAVAAGRRWCLSANGTALRIVDGHRTWRHDAVEIDLLTAVRDPEGRRALWLLAGPASLDGSPAPLDRAVEASARHGVEVCRTLGVGVLDALRVLLRGLAAADRGRQPPEALFERSLTIVYRILVLLFAEARGLVPLWHPLYRDRYSLDVIVSRLLAGGRQRGLWDAVQAISRLAYDGCQAGELQVTAFNGGLFAPAGEAGGERTAVDDETMAAAIAAVSTTSTRAGGRQRIAYRDLDVEQLGAVYEHILDFEPLAGAPGTLVRTTLPRKSSGTFYTPRDLATFLVRRTLEPLVSGRTAGEILALRVLDPAMGSGAFLVAACRFLASAVEDALVRDGQWAAHDVTPADRAALRREVASRCLFGVDLNPSAVQLARLALWLTSLAADKPLSFLDHHLRAGDSLVGASLDDVARQPGGGRRQRRPGNLPLFLGDAVQALGDAVRARLALTAQADDSAPVVRGKERALAALQGPASPLARWSRVLDLWCAGWFWNDGRPPDRALFGELCAHVLGNRHALRPELARPYLARSEAIAGEQRFLHWPLAFPEVFTDASGAPLAEPGFDAVISNPPWDMVRGDTGDRDARNRGRRSARRLGDFARESGIYRVQVRAHLNRYQLFVERALQLARRGGRVGLVLPSGFASDSGAAPLRRHLLDTAAVDMMAGVDNRGGLFPVHRSLRFLLLTCTFGAPTSSIACRFGARDADELERAFERSATGEAPVRLTRALLSRLSGSDDLGIPGLASAADLRIVEAVTASVPWLGATDGWHVRFGRELNATDDRAAFVPRSSRSGARVVVEGKHLGPFRAAVASCTLELAPYSPAGARVRRRVRLAYRDVAGPSNRLTLIAALVPEEAVTTHTVLCLKTPLPRPAQEVLCALLNSYVANYLVRMRVGTHVTAAVLARLPVPVVDCRQPVFDRLAGLARTLQSASAPVEDMPEYAVAQALAAHLYGLAEADFAHVLSTFPLVPGDVKDRTLAAFGDSHGHP